MNVLRRCRGLAMPTVMFVLSIITLLGFSAAYFVNAQQQLGGRYSRAEDALTVAEAGIDKYLWHLNNITGSTNYYEQTVFATGDVEPALVLTSAGSIYYQSTAVNDFDGVGQYRLEVVQPGEDKPLVVRSTGWLLADPNNKRTVEVEFLRRTFTTYSLMMHYQTFPDGTPVAISTGTAIRGNYHTNHSLYTNGSPTFEGRVTYVVDHEHVGPGTPNYTWREDYEPEQVQPLELPPGNQSLATIAKMMTQAYGKQLYMTGRTCVLLDDDVIRIRNRTGSVHTITIPPEGAVLYVDGNRYLNGTTENQKWALDTGNVFVSGRLRGRLTIAANNGIYITGYDPTQFAKNRSEWNTIRNNHYTGGITYWDPNPSTSQDLLGLVANGDVMVLHYNWPNDRNPNFYLRGSGNSNLDVAAMDISIAGAIMAIGSDGYRTGSYGFEAADTGDPKGTITLLGAMCTRYRGGTKTSSPLTGSLLTGYHQELNYDPRLLFEAPPHFLNPANSGWVISSWRELAPED